MLAVNLFDVNQRESEGVGLMSRSNNDGILEFWAKTFLNIFQDSHGGTNFLMEGGKLVQQNGRGES